MRFQRKSANHALPVLAALLSVIAVVVHVGCSSTTIPSGLALQDALVRGLGHSTDDRPSPLAPTKSITAANDDWEMSVRWNPRDLKRTVKWRKDGEGFELVVPLERRPRPWTDSYANVRLTCYGPYQPAHRHVSGGSNWAVTMTHEQVDFPTVEVLLAFLQLSYRREPSQIALAADGTFVRLHVHYSPLGNSLGITVERLTVHGQPPPPAKLKPFLTGRIKEDR